MIPRALALDHRVVLEHDPALLRNAHLAVEIALLHTVEHNDLEAVLKRRQGRADCRLHIDLLLQVAAAWIDLTLLTARFDLTCGQGAHELSAKTIPRL